MDSLPMAPAHCSLDQTGLSTQLERYRAAGERAQIIERTERQVAIRVGDHVPDALIEELVAVERSCCPFFELDWQPPGRYLVIGVGLKEHEPALEAIAAALELGGAGPSEAGSGARR